MLEIVPGNYLTVTPYGVWRAVARADDSTERRILLAILREAGSPELTPAAAGAWTGETDTEAALAPLLRLQEDASLEAWPAPRAVPLGTLETTLS